MLGNALFCSCLYVAPLSEKCTDWSISHLTNITLLSISCGFGRNYSHEYYCDVYVFGLDVPNVLCHLDNSEVSAAWVPSIEKLSIFPINFIKIA